MEKILFENSIEYNKNMIVKLPSADYNITLSSMLYSFNLSYVVTHNKIVENVFNFNHLINLNTCISIEKTIEGNLIVIVQPNVERLASAFNVNLKTKTFLKNEIIEDLENRYREMCYELTEKIHLFLMERNKIINFVDLSYSKSYNKKEEKEFKDMLIRIKAILPTRIIYYADFQDNYGCKVSSKTKVSAIYNYKSFREELKKFISQDTEYISSNEEMIELNKKEKFLKEKLISNPSDKTISGQLKNINVSKNLLNDLFDDLNENRFFTKETLAMICIELEKYIKKEEVLTSFIEKVLNCQTETVLFEN